ncbi:MAG TPA: methionine--tRNA ligase [Candidatus Azoamicus sp.]
MAERFFLTSALPYANGPLHMGHVMEFIQADIFSRYNKIINNFCVYVSGDDCHGTPIMLKSMNEDSSVGFVLNFYNLSHIRDLSNMRIDLDCFYNTNSYENEFFSRRFFYILKLNGFMFETSVLQLYDDDKKIFLPDRYVKGTCPKCYSTNQYGDVCEKCSFKYDATDLIDPISILSGMTPSKVFSNHYFFNLENFRFFLIDWIKNMSQKNTINKLLEWFDFELMPWNISRDIPYFGFRIPCDYYKFFYVWLDAPIGYFSSLYNFCLKNNLQFDIFLNFRLYHFIGKDIIYFHSLFWPSLLHGCFLNPPIDVFVHGFLTINGKKMSKSAGTLFSVADFLNFYEPDFVRYYFASKLNDSILDIDFRIEDFVEKINSDLISKFINIGSRCVSIICNNFECKTASDILDKNMFLEFLSLWPVIQDFYSKRSYSKVIISIMKYADFINVYLDREKPWILLKNKDSFLRSNLVCTTALNLFIILLFYIKPILPDLIDRFEYILNLNNISFDLIQKPFVNFYIKKYMHVYKKIDVYNIIKSL